MRIITGSLRGRNLAKSDHIKTLRPTTDANREALFNILNAAHFVKKIGFELAGANMLDICCGSGSISFEAISRGVTSALLIDNNKTHLDLAKQNAEILGLANKVRFLLCNARTSLPNCDNDFQLIFIDPPYEYNCTEILTNLKNKNFLRPNQLIVVETGTTEKNKIECPEFLELLDQRQYGITEFYFFQPK